MREQQLRRKSRDGKGLAGLRSGNKASLSSKGVVKGEVGEGERYR